MMIPRFLYGRYGSVMTRCRALSKQILAGGPDSAAYGDFFDTQTSPGLLLLAKDPSVADKDNFHCFALSQALVTAVPHPRWLEVTGAWLRWCFEEPWRFLFIFDRESAYAMVRQKELLHPYVAAAVKFWPILSSVGNRFGPCFGNEPSDAWTVSSGLHFALANLGITAEELRAPLPEAGVSGFLARIKSNQP